MKTEVNSTISPSEPAGPRLGMGTFGLNRQQAKVECQIKVFLTESSANTCNSSICAANLFHTNKRRCYLPAPPLIVGKAGLSRCFGWILTGTLHKKHLKQL